MEVHELKDILDDKFAGINIRLDRIDERAARTDERSTRTEEKSNQLDEKIIAACSQIDGMEKILISHDRWLWLGKGMITGITGFITYLGFKIKW